MARSSSPPSLCCCSIRSIVLVLGGGLQRLIPRRSRAAAATTIVVALLALTLAHATAQTAPASVPELALETKLAYVVTGNAEVDAISKAGLAGLTLFLAQRTALEPGDPIGLDIAHDELAFYPLIYWPVVPGTPRPSEAALKRIDTYMKDGGTVLFDTRDAVTAPPGPGGETRSPGMLELRQILSSLDIPELEPVPRDHVLTKTFYLLRDFPGRFDNGQLWVEALPEADEDEATSGRPARGGDGVSSIIISSNDFAGAWAIAARRPADAADGRGRTAPARDGIPRRRQHRHVHAHRQLQSRPGACAGAARAAGAVGESFEFRRCVRSSCQHARFLWAALAVAALLALLLFASRSRGAVDPDAGAGADRAGARQSLVHARGPRSAELGRRRRRRQEPEPEFRRPHAADRGRARRRGRAARPHTRPRSAHRRGRTGRRRNRRHAAVHRARLERSPTCRPIASPASS